MRLWSLHPSYLDPAGLVALWREGLLARAVLLGKTRGYQSHPQLDRFRAAADAVEAINRYLHAVLREAQGRGYRFNAGLLEPLPDAPGGLLPLSRGQLEYEMALLRHKLLGRNKAWLARLETAGAFANLEPNPLFELIPGTIAVWERPKDMIWPQATRMPLEVPSLVIP